MCAPHQLRMQPTPLSRTHSHATSARTLVGSDTGPYSPWHWNGTASPILQTPDQKQWIDLELLNPKLLKGLSQYTPSIRDEPNSKIGKGAAKFKAWARQSKAGIDIRLRRKINAEKDEVTFIQLRPSGHVADSSEKPHPVQELPAMNSVLELEDTAKLPPMELDATQNSQPSRSSTQSSLSEPPPSYQTDPSVSPLAPLNTFAYPSPSVPATPDRANDQIPRSVSPVMPADVGHRPSSSQTSIVTTPTRGLSLRDPGDSPSMNGDLKDDSDQHMTLLRADLEESNKKLDEERQMNASLQAVIDAISHEQSRPPNVADRSAQSPATNAPKHRFANRLLVAKRTTYETETDVEPPSPPSGSQRKGSSPSGRKKGVTFPKETQAPAATAKNDESVLNSSDGEPDAATSTLIRKQTLPKRTPASAGVEAMWWSLIRMQTILLGPEHRLTVRAKADFVKAKAKNQLNEHAGLMSLRQGRVVAKRDFGADHPWVAAFFEDLSKLENLIRPDSKTRPAAKDSPGESTEVATEDTSVETKHDAFALPPAVVVTEDAAVIPANADTRLHKIDTTVQNEHSEKEPSPVVGGVEIDSQLDVLWNTSRQPHSPQSNHIAFARLVFAAVSRVAWNGITWLQRNYGPEQPVANGKTRVRWTCSCGQRLHDDFIEKRPGAARALEAYLNRPKGVHLAPVPTANYAQTREYCDLAGRLNADTIEGPGTSGSSPATAGSSPGGRSFGSSVGAPPSSHTSFSSNIHPNGASWHSGDDSKMQQTWSGMPSHMPFSPTYEPPWLLTCATEDRFTPKVTHLDMSRHKIHSDKDLANSLRDHYFNVNKKWWRALRLRGLTTIEFVQFEVHQNRLADIRKVPDVPLKGRPDYNFEPSDLLPPVGSTYLLHLFKHPEDYDGELITYLRAPKRNGRLQLGVGWGVHLVEGFVADKVWMWMSAMFGIGSGVFGVVYAVKKHDVQGAFGVAAWIVTLAALAAGWLQACLG